MVPRNRDNQIATRAAKLEIKEVANARNAKGLDCTRFFSAELRFGFYQSFVFVCA